MDNRDSLIAQLDHIEQLVRSLRLQLEQPRATVKRARPTNVQEAIQKGIRVGVFSDPDK